MSLKRFSFSFEKKKKKKEIPRRCQSEIRRLIKEKHTEIDPIDHFVMDVENRRIRITSPANVSDLICYEGYKFIIMERPCSANISAFLDVLIHYDIRHVFQCSANSYHTVLFEKLDIIIHVSFYS